MSHGRREFLTRAFQLLNERAVPYCVLRNYQAIYDQTDSDIDLGVDGPQIASVEGCLAEAATAAGYRLVHRARYVNASLVYWHPTYGFIRVDLENEIRWRVFPVLSGAALLGLRRPHELFYVPHPRHESVIVWTAALWRGHLSDRYRQRLAALYPEVGDPEILRRTLRAAFGAVGNRLGDCQARIREQQFGPHFWKGFRRSVILNAFQDGPTRQYLYAYLKTDLARFFERLDQPPGISLLCATAAESALNLEELFAGIEFLFPAQKSVVHACEQRSNRGCCRVLSPAQRLQRHLVLFKGGIFLRACAAPSDRELTKAIALHGRSRHPARVFFCAETPRNEAWLGHANTGFMAEIKLAPNAPVPTGAVVQFISSVLEKVQSAAVRPHGTRGVLAVLVGLDGSGKTTVARQLCCLGPTQDRFRRIRYFHWRPRCRGGTVFPLPEYGNVPRKPALNRNLVRSAMSIARLSKNVLMANLAYWLRLRSLLQDGSLVLIDRYFYNYFLDPVSVKYYGPTGLLRRLCRWYPQPDLVVVLQAPPEVLLARKQELSREEILRQSAALAQLPYGAAQTLVLDATAPATEIAQAILEKAGRLAPP